jgi:hypothetical protein
MTPPTPPLTHAFIAACGFLASAGFLRFVIRKPAPAKTRSGQPPR